MHLRYTIIFMWQFESNITQIINRTPGVKSFRFAINQPGVRYRPGQYFYVTLDIDGKHHVHHFSFSSSPTEKGYIEFTKRITNSVYSTALDHATPGTWALIEGPEGSFTLTRKREKLCFICGGIGITPLRSMLIYVKQKRLPYDITLLYASRSAEDIIFRSELDALNLENARVLHFVSRKDGSASSNLIQGYIDKDAIAQMVPDYDERLFYISGPPGMLGSMLEHVTALGVSSKRIKFDAFTGYQ